MGSFPKESQHVTWSENVLRRIAGKCLGDAWRADAGGCPQCGDHLDSCVADCIKSSLCADGSVAMLQATWDRVFANPQECPDVPLPAGQCTMDEAASGQRQIHVPGCVGAGCNANGEDQDCAWCVYDIGDCVQSYGESCQETVAARAAQGASCAVPGANMSVIV